MTQTKGVDRRIEISKSESFLGILWAIKHIVDYETQEEDHYKTKEGVIAAVREYLDGEGE